MTVARRALAVSALALVAAGCATGRYKVKGRPVPYEGFYATFPSGMRLVVYEMPHVDRFMFAVSYRAGSVDDPPGKEGLAHLAEHMAFRARPGGKGRPRIFDQLVATGWWWSAFTSADGTDYWEVGKPADLREALALEAARMLDPLAGVTEDDLAVEREVVLSEWRERFETDPAGAELQWLMEAALPGHPYARPAGTPESLRRITLEDLRAWMGRHYTAQGAVMVLIAPRPARESVAELVEAFGHLIGEGAPRAEPLKYQPPALPEEPRVPGGLQRRKGPVDYPRLWVAWSVPGYYARGVPQTLAVDAALYSSVAARLANWWNQGLVHGVGTGVTLRDGAGLMYVRVELDRAEDAERVADAVRFAAEKLRVGWRMPGEWLRDRLLVDAYRDMEQIYAPAVSRFVRAYGMPDYLRYWSAMVAVQLQYTVDAYADRFLSSSRSAAVLVEPDHNTAATSVAGGGAPVRAENPVPLEYDLAGQAPPLPERIAAAARAPGLDKAERRTLPNGLEVVVARRGTLPIAEVRLVIRTDAEGAAGSPFGVRRLAMAASSSLFSDLRQIRLGAERFEEVRPDSLVMGVRGSSGNLEGLVESISEWGRDLRTGHTNWVLKALVQRLEWDARRPSRRARQALLTALFPDHAYGRALLPRDLEEHGFVAAGDWLERQIRPERATLVIASDVPPSPELWEFIEGQFGKWKPGDAGPPQPAAEPPLPARRRVVLVQRPGASQALLWVGVRAPPRSARDEPGIDGLHWLLGSKCGAGLRLPLRHRRRRGGRARGAGAGAAVPRLVREAARIHRRP